MQYIIFFIIKIFFIILAISVIGILTIITIKKNKHKTYDGAINETYK